MRYLTALFFCGIIFILSCSGSKDSTSSDNDPTFGDGTIYTTINWIGTDIVYDSLAEKNNFSLLYFKSDGCGWCQLMERETFTNASVKQIIGESFNISMLNTSVDTSVIFKDSSLSINELKNHYSFIGVPTTIVLDKKGDYIGKITGYYDANTFYGILHNIRLNY